VHARVGDLQKESRHPSDDHCTSATCLPSAQAGTTPTVNLPEAERNGKPASNGARYTLISRDCIEKDGVIYISARLTSSRLNRARSTVSGYVRHGKLRTAFHFVGWLWISEPSVDALVERLHTKSKRERKDD
jgi:hypothetical protein